MTRKCNWCKKNDAHMDDMEFVLVGKAKPVKKFYHKGECWEEYQTDRAFKEKEAQEKLELKETIERIYKIKELPRQVYPFLEGLRNGTPVMQGQQTGKRYKEGYNYSLIKATYEFIEETLNYYHETKDDFNGFMSEFKYGLAIVIDKIYKVEQRVKNRQIQEEKMERHIKKAKASDDDYVSNYKKPKDKDGIEDFLDD